MEQDLIKMAIEAMKNSHARNSNFNVGAALLTKSGKVFTGPNIESPTFLFTICAERTAIFKAISEGEKEFQAMAIVGGQDGVCKELTFPCGICRQTILEFCDNDFKIILGTTPDKYEVYEIKDLMPHGFKL